MPIWGLTIKNPLAGFRNMGVSTGGEGKDFNRKLFGDHSTWGVVPLKKELDDQVALRLYHKIKTQ